MRFGWAAHVVVGRPRSGSIHWHSLVEFGLCVRQPFLQPRQSLVRLVHELLGTALELTPASLEGSHRLPQSHVDGNHRLVEVIHSSSDVTLQAVIHGLYVASKGAHAVANRLCVRFKFHDALLMDLAYGFKFHDALLMDLACGDHLRDLLIEHLHVFHEDREDLLLRILLRRRRCSRCSRRRTLLRRR